MDVLIADLFDVEETAFCANVGFTKIFYPVDNGGTNCTRDAVVVGLAHAAERGDAGFGEEVLRVV